jgi:hypothetical protein
LPSPIPAATAVPMFNPELVSSLLSCIHISVQDEGNTVLRLETPPTELNTTPLLTWSATGSANANLTTLQASRPPVIRPMAGQPLNLSVTKLLQLKSVEFMYVTMRVSLECAFHQVLCDLGRCSVRVH